MARTPTRRTAARTPARKASRRSPPTQIPPRDPNAPAHPGPGKSGRIFHAQRFPAAGFSTIKSPSVSQPFRPLPTPPGPAPYHLSLDSVLSAPAIQRIRQNGRLALHAVGDTGGVNTPTPQEIVTRYMERDFATTGDLSRNPSFFYHIGDVVYYAGETANYYPEFYEPYNMYPAPIFAIPGNHDGDVDPLAPEASLAPFVRNFCAKVPVHTPEAQDSPRHAMTQPNVYWTLEAELATIIGLYSNCPEGGELEATQIAWFQEELAAAPRDQALIVAVHHPIYSAYGPHPGSQPLHAVFEQACQASKRIPDLVLTGHVHNYQRFTGPLAGRTINFIVAGAGGYNQQLHLLSREFDPKKVPIQMVGSTGTLESFCDTNHGYLVIQVTPTSIHCEYRAVPNVDPNLPAAKLPAAKVYDAVDIQIGG